MHHLSVAALPKLAMGLAALDLAADTVMRHSIAP